MSQTNDIDKSQRKLFGKIIIQSTIEVKTGLHIGGGAENLDIGGLDHPVIRDPLTLEPYLPGSSLKGKLRSILERYLNKPLNRKGGDTVHRYESDDIEDGYTDMGGNNVIRFDGARHCELSRIFGSTGDDCWILKSLALSQELTKDNDPVKKLPDDNGEEYVKIKGRNYSARLIVRDAHLTDESVEKLSKIDTGLYMTEWKFENSIDRVTSAANPRQLERVPAGSLFNFEMVYTVEDEKQVGSDLANLAIALKILEDDALGGHGSRGYGKVRFTEFNIMYRTLDFYSQIAEESQAIEPPSSNSQDTENSRDKYTETFEDTDDLFKKFQKVRELVKQEKDKIENE